jgi:hypothetical protein
VAENASDFIVMESYIKDLRFSYLKAFGLKLFQKSDNPEEKVYISV